LRQILLLVFLMFLLKMLPFVASSPLVTLSSGTFRGLTVNSTDRWLGIPYAQPPVGPLRFKAPLTISRSSGGTQDAFQFSHACPQPPTTAPISEDCLYLNVRHVITFSFMAPFHLGVCRCGDHNRLRLRRSFLSLFGYMYECSELDHLQSDNLPGGWCI
jgi:hypothetical protein